MNTELSHHFHNIHRRKKSQNLLDLNLLTSTLDSNVDEGANEIFQPKLSVLYKDSKGSKQPGKEQGVRAAEPDIQSLVISDNKDVKLDLNSEQLKNLDILLSLLEPPLDIVQKTMDDGREAGPDTKSKLDRGPIKPISEYRNGILDLINDGDDVGLSNSPEGELDEANGEDYANEGALARSQQKQHRNDTIPIYGPGPKGHVIKDMVGKGVGRPIAMVPFVSAIAAGILLLAIIVILLFLWCYRWRKKGGVRGKKHNPYCLCDTCRKERAALISAGGYDSGSDGADGGGGPSNLRNMPSSTYPGQLGASASVCKYCGNDIKSSLSSTGPGGGIHPSTFTRPMDETYLYPGVGSNNQDPVAKNIGASGSTSAFGEKSFSYNLSRGGPKY